ncbi:TIGR03915 family putative DNA repair protein [Vandammella animalimorsus]|uniref:TIGR03915 family putative DNA repair protein n=1 Tax=Vandammella animalimorsus TaxID=2029117 RepID=UPI0031BB1F49
MSHDIGRGMGHWQARVTPPWSLEAWRDQARQAWCAAIAPEALDWLAGDERTLIAAAAVAQAPVQRPAPHVPKNFLALAMQVLCHREPQRFALLYRLLWRLASGERGLLDRVTDPDVHHALRLAQAVRRDTHKMKAFVRFRELPGQTDAFVAWFEPEHWIVDRVAPFFARRFTGMRWCLLTPYRSAAWDGAQLQYGPGAQREAAPGEDPGEALWQTYYAHIFNPARLNPRMMRQEMPQKYWHLLPEAQLLPQLMGEAGARVQAMTEREWQPPKRRIGKPPA